MLKRADGLDGSKDERARLEEALASNRPLATAYYLKEELRQFWEQPGRRFAAVFLDGWIRRAEASGVAPLKQMARTLSSHRDGLPAYYDAFITSGPLEGPTTRSRR